MSRRLIPLTALAVASVFAGCSSDEDSASPAPSNTNEAVIEEAEAEAVSADEVVRVLQSELKAQPDEIGDLEFQPPGAGTPCYISVVMTTPEEIALYEGAGDTVIKNPAGTVGVKITSTAEDEVTCLRAVSNALKAV